MIFNYFSEIKNRIILITISWIFNFLICYKYKKVLLFIFIKPSLYLFQTKSIYFISTNLVEIFSTHLKLSSFIGTQIIILFFFYHILTFITPGLFKFEYKNFYFILLSGGIIWITTISLLYKYILPWSWKFFLSFEQITSNNNMHIYFEAKLYEYLEFFIILYKICNINCQFLLLIIFYINVINKSIKFIKNYRKFIYFFIFLIASLITPPDIISQICVGIFTIFIFETLILLILINNKIK
jgi:sec-independent protein translocase protein TatC